MMESKLYALDDKGVLHSVDSCREVIDPFEIIPSKISADSWVIRQPLPLTGYLLLARYANMLRPLDPSFKTGTERPGVHQLSSGGYTLTYLQYFRYGGRGLVLSSEKTHRVLVLDIHEVFPCIQLSETAYAGAPTTVPVHTGPEGVVLDSVTEKVYSVRRSPEGFFYVVYRCPSQVDWKYLFEEVQCENTLN